MKIRKINRAITQQVLSEIRMAFVYIKSNIQQAAELRFSFIMQVIGMMVNNTAFLMVWVFFFQSFGSINGWNSYEVIALQGYVAIIYGFCFSFFSGASELPSIVNNGVFDNLLLTPRNLYMRILTLVTRSSTIGDLIYGFILILIYTIFTHISLLQLFVLFSLLIPSTVIITNFSLITSCIAFFIPDSDELSKNAFELMFGPSMYPSGLFQGVTRLFFLFILPSIVVGGLPVETVTNLSLFNYLLIWGLAILWTVATLFVLKNGLRKYESGNLTGARI